jgi:hypothetical protein
VKNTRDRLAAMRLRPGLRSAVPAVTKSVPKRLKPSGAQGVYDTCDGAPFRMTILREFGEKHAGQVSGYEIASWIEFSRSCSNEERT